MSLWRIREAYKQLIRGGGGGGGSEIERGKGNYLVVSDIHELFGLRNQVVVLQQRIVHDGLVSVLEHESSRATVSSIHHTSEEGNVGHRRTWIPDHLKTLVLNSTAIISLLIRKKRGKSAYLVCSSW